MIQRISRPIYESAEDLKNERSVAKKIATTYGLDLKKMHMKYSIDYMAFDKSGEAVAVIEVKRRKNKYKKYQSVILSLAKYNRGVEYDRANDLQFIFAVEFDDGCYIYEYQPGDLFRIQLGGRTDRNDKQDIEPVIHIPINRMNRL